MIARMEFPRTEVGVKFDGGERDFWDVGGGGRRHAPIVRAAESLSRLTLWRAGRVVSVS